MTVEQKALRVLVEKPDAKKLEELKIKQWPVWTKAPGVFDWHYDEPEVCYFLEGDVTVETAAGNVSFGRGDLVTFPRGLSCKWHVKKAVKKHYRFG